MIHMMLSNAVIYVKQYHNMIVIFINFRCSFMTSDVKKYHNIIVIFLYADSSYATIDVNQYISLRYIFF
jgi:hypothetical protein